MPALWLHPRSALLLCLWLAGVAFAGEPGAPASNTADPRDQEIAECLPGDIVTWPDGRDRPAGVAELLIVYRHTDAPEWFTAESVMEFLSRAATAWSQCGIPIRVQMQSPGNPASAPPGSVRVRWSAAESRGNVGLSNLKARTLTLGPQAFALLHERNPAHDATQTLQMVISHEMGHFLGLMAHSRRCVDVLSYYHDGKGQLCSTRNPRGLRQQPEYRHTLPTACDIQRCRQINGISDR